MASTEDLQQVPAVVLGCGGGREAARRLSKSWGRLRGVDLRFGGGAEAAGSREEVGFAVGPWKPDGGFGAVGPDRLDSDVEC